MKFVIKLVAWCWCSGVPLELVLCCLERMPIAFEVVRRHPACTQRIVMQAHLKRHRAGVQAAHRAARPPRLPAAAANVACWELGLHSGGE